MHKNNIVEASDSNFELKNGILFFGNIPFEGMTTTYHTTKELASETQYESGRKHGYEKQWYPNGNIAMERYYHSGKKVKTHSAWWENGTLRFEYQFNDKGAYHGTVSEWYPDGQLLRAFNYINGQETGSQRLWKSNGNIKANYEVWNGERFGLIGLKKCYKVKTNSIEIE